MIKKLIFLTSVLIFCPIRIVHAQKVSFLGEKGLFFQSLFIMDSNYKDKITIDPAKAEVLIYLEPTYAELQDLIKRSEYEDKKALFMFYYFKKKGFETLPCIYLNIKTQWIDEHILNFKSNTPFSGPYPSEKVLLAIQYDVWKESFQFIDMAGTIKNFKTRVKLD